MDNVEQISKEIWTELLKASRIEPPMSAKPYYDDMVKKVFQDFKKPSQMTVED
jgi:hypothetical protein